MRFCILTGSCSPELCPGEESRSSRDSRSQLEPLVSLVLALRPRVGKSDSTSMLELCVSQVSWLRFFLLHMVVGSRLVNKISTPNQEVVLFKCNFNIISLTKHRRKALLTTVLGQHQLAIKNI